MNYDKRIEEIKLELALLIEKYNNVSESEILDMWNKNEHPDVLQTKKLTHELVAMQTLNNVFSADIDGMITYFTTELESAVNDEDYEKAAFVNAVIIVLKKQKEDENNISNTES